MESEITSESGLLASEGLEFIKLNGFMIGFRELVDLWIVIGFTSFLEKVTGASWAVCRVFLSS